MAEAMGRHSAKEVVDDLGRDFAKDHLEALMGTYTALGFADVALEPGWSSEPRLTVHARQLFECQANIKRKVRRRSVFFRAHIRGFVEEIYGAEAEVEEVQCLAEGGEECSFRVSVPAPVQARAKAREPDPQS
jgi:predicted hydrocarbon binding protein